MEPPWGAPWGDGAGCTGPWCQSSRLTRGCAAPRRRPRSHLLVLRSLRNHLPGAWAGPSDTLLTHRVKQKRWEAPSKTRLQRDYDTCSARGGRLPCREPPHREAQAAGNQGSPWPRPARSESNLSEETGATAYILNST